MSDPAKKQTQEASPIAAFVVNQPIKVPWRPSFARQLAEYKATDGEVFEAGEHMLILRRGKQRMGVPWSNVKYVEFA